MSITSELSLLLGEAFAKQGLDPSFGEVSVSSRPDLGQFQCNGALPAGKTTKRNPREVAQQVVSQISNDPRLADVSVAGPGFINLTLTDDSLARHMNRMAQDEERLGVPPVRQPLKVVVDYAGPNVAKAMHVGHLRATIIGDSIKRLMRFLGHQVLGDVHFGDWGLQMGMLIVAAQRHFPDLPHFEPDHSGPFPSPPVDLQDLQTWYPAISEEAKCNEEVADATRLATSELQSGRAGYMALWEHFVEVSRQSQKQDFANLGVEFDLWYGESTVRDRLRPLVDRALQTEVAVKDEGAVIIKVAEPADRAEITPLVIETSRGAFLYSTTDLATIEMRTEVLGADLILYIVDARQSYHFVQLFRAAHLIGIAGETEMEHIPFGTMNGKDGRPFKTREGGVLALQDLIQLVTDEARRRLDESELASGFPATERKTIAQQVGLAALKFGDLINNRASNYVFDPRRFTALEGKTGPYLQMAAVRMGSILTRAQEHGLASGLITAPAHDTERQLMLRLLDLPETVARTAELRSPNQLAEYAYEVASDFSRFYESCHILSEEDPDRQASWLALVATTRRTMRLLLDLMGIEIPNRM